MLSDGTFPRASEPPHGPNQPPRILVLFGHPEDELGRAVHRGLFNSVVTPFEAERLKVLDPDIVHRDAQHIPVADIGHS